MPRVTANFLLQQGHIADQSRMFFLTNDPAQSSAEIPNGQLFILANGSKLTQKGFDWNGVAVTTVSRPVRACYVVGREGEVLVGTAGGFNQETIGDAETNPQRRGPLRNARAVDDEVYAVGMGRQVYQRLATGQWVPIEQGLPTERPRGVVLGFNSIDGSSPDNLYAVGWGGEMWHRTQSRWNPIESPTNLALFDVLVISPELVFVCGKPGLIRGAETRWEIVEYEGPVREFRSMAWFNDTLYLADGRALYRLDGNTLDVVDFGAGTLVPCHHIHARDGLLLSIAGKEAWTTSDGFKWEELPQI